MLSLQVALPVLEGQEMAADMTGTLSVQEAALRAENDPLCCGFVRQVTENVFYWKRAGSGFSRIFRQDAASVSGKWETYYIKERMDTAAEDVLDSSASPAAAAAADALMNASLASSSRCFRRCSSMQSSTLSAWQMWHLVGSSPELSAAFRKASMVACSVVKSFV